MNWRTFLRWSMILLPFTMFMGVAIQAIGLYLFVFLIPLLSLFLSDTKKDGNSFTYPTALRFVPMALLIIWAIFPLSNFLSVLRFDKLLIGNETFDFQAQTHGHLSWKKLLESRLSSAWLLSVIAMLVALVGVKRNKRLPMPFTKVTETFMWGLTVSTILWVLFMSFQHFSGFDPKSASHLLKPEHRMANGTYRVFGAYGHPLSVASVALAFMAFFWMLFCSSLASDKHTSSFLKVFKNQSKRTHLSIYFIATFMCFLGIVMSGGRTALAIGVATYCLVPMFAAPNRAMKWISFAAAGVCSSVLLMIVFSGNLLSRFDHLFALIKTGQFENRGYFWEVYLKMIADSPWLGYGHFFVENGLRDLYYQRFGFGNLQEKFNAHNVYLETLANVGAVGFVSIVLLIFFVYRQIATELRERKNACVTLYFKCLSAAFIVNLVHGFTQNVFFDSNVMIPCIVMTFVGFHILISEIGPTASLEKVRTHKP
jgi:O-antigen ligase